MRSLLAIMIVASTAFGHEYWFEPDSFFLKPRETTVLHLYVGEALKKDEERPYQASKTLSFQMFSSDGPFDMRTMADDDRAPIMKFSAEATGTYLFSMERNWSYITLGANDFEDYLREDGMEYIIAERKRLGESKKDGRERYSRYLKTLIQVGDIHSRIIKNRVNTRLEIVPLDNPYAKKIGDTMTIQVWFDRRPLSDSTLFVDNRDGDNITTQKLTTDKDGKAKVKLDRKGVWLIRLVFMQRCEKNCGEADWESFWGALSFGVR